MKFPYDDIIHLEAPVSKKHGQMPLSNRAAQFAPFSALTGYETSIIETRRQTEKKIELDKDAVEELEFKLDFLLSNVKEIPYVKITYFVQDKNKEGGEYHTITEQIKKYDEVKQILILANRKEISIQDILTVDSSLFDSFL